MSGETLAVNARLEEWAKWYLGKVRIGHVACNLGPVIHYGVRGTRGVDEQEVPPHVVAVERAVCKLGEIDRRVIFAFYDRHEQSAEDLARRAGMRVSQFRNVLRRARWRIGGYLDAGG
jgi:DNA-directed RNA polymerase specialized sigma24 family protein